MILDVGRIRVTFVAIRTLYTTYTAQMTYVIIEIFPPFEPLPASIAVQIVAVEIRIRIFHATNLVFLFARVPHVERQISLLGERLAALRTLYSVRPCTGRRVFPFWKLKTQTRYVEQTFSRASIPSRLSKVKGGGGRWEIFRPPFRSLCGPSLRVHTYTCTCVRYHCVRYMCVCMRARVRIGKVREKKNIDFRRLKRRYIIYKRLFTQVTPKSRQETPRKRWIRFFPSCGILTEDEISLLTRSHPRIHTLTEITYSYPSNPIQLDAIIWN